MITLFTIPKSFNGSMAIIQTNAIKSWLCLHPDIEVILFGDDCGTAELASQLGLRYYGETKRNKQGTPLLDSLFADAQKYARYDTIGYVNGDIILMNDFIKTVQQIKLPQYLAIGQRWDANIKGRCSRMCDTNMGK